MEKNKKIIMWDDVPFWLSKKDSEEKIKEDLLKLCIDYKKAKERPHFTSVLEAFRDIHIDNTFLIGLIGIITRIDRLNKNE